MREVNKSVLVQYLQGEMFSLVDGIESYPEFLPWCGGASVAHRDDRVTRATLHIDYRGVKQSFTTENTKSYPDTMTLALVSGPFRSLSGSWRFTDLGGRGCKVEFRLSYDFSSRLLETLVGPVFSHITDTIVDSFVKRAEKRYGRRT